MSILTNKLDRLEAKIAPKGRQTRKCIALTGGNQSESEIDEFLKNNAINPKADNLKVLFRSIVKPSSNGPVCCVTPLSFR